MHLSHLKLRNFRTFGSTEEFTLKVPHRGLGFNSDLDVLIGENDFERSAIIDAVRLVLKTYSFERLVGECFV